MNFQAPPPPSGVASLTPTQVRARALELGWPVIPIVAHDAAHTGAGKAPSIRRWQCRALFEGQATTLSDLKEWERTERQAPGTGIPCGSVVAFDADFATDVLLAIQVRTVIFDVCGWTPFERKGAHPKFALIYPAAEAMPSVSLKTADGSGDGFDVLAEGRQIVAFGTHRKTLNSYAWTGAETPLTASPDAAPEVTQDQVEEVIRRVRQLVELSGTGGRARGRGGESATIVRNAEGLVIDGREYHLTRTVYATACAMHADGIEITVSDITERAWAAFVASTVLDDGRWSLEAARVKAAALLDRVRRKLVDLGDRRQDEGERIEPTYPDLRATVAEAEAAIGAVVSAFFTEHVPAWKRELLQWRAEIEEAEERGQPKPQKPDPVSHAARVETAIGKTAQAIRGAATAAKTGLNIVYAAPTHGLLGELAERFAAEGVEARVYRGYASPDPDAPDLAMCLDLPAMEDAKAAVRPIPSTVCEKRVDGQKLYCPFHDRCGMEKQRRANAPVWLVPHALLFHAKPEAIPAPDALVIDEGVTMGALPDKPARLSLDAIERAPIDPSDDAPIFTNYANDLDAARGSLLRALRDHRDDGPLQRATLLRHGVTVAVAASAYSLEWGRLRDPGILPGMEPKARKALAGAVGQHNTEVKLLAGLWGELRAFLAGDAEASGRLSLRYDEKAEARILERRSLDTVRDTWLAPALLIDATLPEPSLLDPVMGHRVEVKADITARWSPSVKVRQIVGAPVTARKLGIIDSDNDEEAEGAPAGVPKRVITDLLRLIRLRAALVWPRVVVVIAPKRLIERLNELGLPENVETGHFGAIAGIDRWARAAGLVCIGRLQPGPGVTEPLAGIVTGVVPEAIPPNPQGGRWYHRVAGAIRLADGQGTRVERVEHPDPTVEALRWQITEAGLIQAIGRLRALRRDPDSPAFLDIINDVPLPVSVDGTSTWDAAKPGAWAEMAPEGVLLESAADIMACFPEVAPTRQAAREVALPTMVVTSLRELNIDVTTIVRHASYKRLGRFQPARALLLPNAPTDLKSWLFDRLGAIEWVKIEDIEQGTSSEEPPTAAAQASRAPFPCAADIEPDLAAAYRCVAKFQAATAPLAPVIPEIVRFDPTAGIRFPPAILDRLERARLAEIAAAFRSIRTNGGRSRPERTRREAGAI